LPTSLTSAWPAWGWPALVGVLALLTGLWLSLGLAPQWSADQQVLQAQVLLAPRRAKAPVKAPAPLASLTWPAAAQTPSRVAALLALAPQHGVTIERAQQSADASGSLRLVLSARGGYGAVRQFVAAALANDAHLALTRVRMQRASAKTSDLEAELQWLLVQRRPAPAATASAQTSASGGRA
jgi:hypothetical protein